MQLRSTLIAALIASVAGLGVSAAPIDSSLEKRIVGSLSCKTVKTGKLALVNTKTGASYPATLNTNYRLQDRLKGQNPDSVQGAGNPRLLTSYNGVTSDGSTYNFQACTESQSPGFQDYPAKSKSGVYHGHLSPADAPKHCLQKQTIYADDQVLTSVTCNYSDDSGSPLSYFSYNPNKNGLILFPRYTGKNGGYPRPADNPGVYTFTPGTKSEPAVYVHDGSYNFSDWELRLV